MKKDRIEIEILKKIHEEKENSVESKERLVKIAKEGDAKEKV